MKRRSFLHNLGHASLASFFSNELLYGLNFSKNTYLTNTVSQGKIIVIVKLFGGNDGLNTLIPLDQMSSLNNARPHVVLPDNRIINLGEKDLGLHLSLIHI